MNIVITSEQILWLCGAIASVYAVYKIYKTEILKPKDDMKEMISDHEEKLKNDDERLKEIELTNKLILQSLLVIINHDITGNGIDQLKKARNDIQQYLIDK